MLPQSLKGYKVVIEWRRGGGGVWCDPLISLSTNLNSRHVAGGLHVKRQGACVRCLIALLFLSSYSCTPASTTRSHSQLDISFYS
ncbi:hypothetical protein FKM82_012168 [Ascaphus truei]